MKKLITSTLIVAGLCLSEAQAQVSLHGIYADTPQNDVTVLFAVHDNNTIGIFIFDSGQKKVGHAEAAINPTGAFHVNDVIGYAVDGQLGAPLSGANPSITGSLTSGSTVIPIDAPRTPLFNAGNVESYIGRFEGIAYQPGTLHKTDVLFLIDANLHLYFVNTLFGGILTGGTGTVTPNASNNGGTFTATAVTGAPITGTFTSNAFLMNGSFTVNTTDYEFTATRIHAMNRLGNISTRGFVSSGQGVLIGGFWITGGPKLVLIRVLGPSLSQFGITQPLPDPTVTLYSGQRVLKTNTGWTTAPNVADINASRFAPGMSADCAILTALEPGGYTTVVKGASDDTGIALMEVYEVSLD